MTWQQCFVLCDFLSRDVTDQSPQVQGKNKSVFEMNQGSSLPQYRVSFRYHGETRQQPQKEARAPG